MSSTKPRRVIKEHEVRKNELLDVGQKLFGKLGYESTTISAILEAAGVAKGTFYHYFKSKEDLLDCLVARITDQITERVRQRLAKPGLSALQKLNLFFVASAEWKAEHQESLRSIVRPIMSNENVLLRRRMNQRTLECMGPLLTLVVRQGIEERVFDTAFPEQAAELILGLAVALQESNAELLLSLSEHPNKLEALIRRAECFQDAVERLLGAPQGSVEVLTERAVEAYRS